MDILFAMSFFEGVAIFCVVRDAILPIGQSVGIVSCLT